MQASRLPVGGPWTFPVTLSTPGAVSIPQVAASRSGSAIAVWSFFDGNNRLAQAARLRADGTWTDPVSLSDPGQDAYNVQIAVDQHGNAVAAWDRSDGDHDRVQASHRPAGEAWGDPVDLSEVGQDARHAVVAMDGSGKALVAWERFDGSSYVVQTARRTVTGTWGTPATISGPAQGAFRAQVALDADGDAVAVWDSFDGLSFRVQTASQAKGMSWSSPSTLAESDSSNPDLALDADGNGVAVWYGAEGVNFRIQAAGLDAAGPISTVTVPSVFTQTAARFTVSWTADDTWSRSADHEVRVRTARHDSTFGPWTTWMSETTTHSATFSGKPGRTYCFSARARDTSITWALGRRSNASPRPSMTAPSPVLVRGLLRPGAATISVPTRPAAATVPC